MIPVYAYFCSAMECSSAMASMDETDYETKLWPPLKNAVNMLLTQQPGVYLKISYEEMYR